MSGGLSLVLVLALASHAAFHVAVVAGLARIRHPHAFLRAALGFFVPPLAVYWALQAGMRRRVIGWAAALTIYALGVAVA